MGREKGESRDTAPRIRTSKSDAVCPASGDLSPPGPPPHTKAHQQPHREEAGQNLVGHGLCVARARQPRNRKLVDHIKACGAAAEVALALAADGNNLDSHADGCQVGLAALRLWEVWEAWEV
eukprot:362321-Chlamydomonas_euryale.AAC.12